MTEEIAAGQKQSCWIWYVCSRKCSDPGRHSANITTYQILSKQEGVDYLLHPVLGERYRRGVQLVSQHLRGENPRNQPLHLAKVFNGFVDAKKYYHSVSTFALASVHGGLREWCVFFLYALRAIFESKLTTVQEASVLMFGGSTSQVGVAEITIPVEEWPVEQLTEMLVVSVTAN